MMKRLILFLALSFLSANAWADIVVQMYATTGSKASLGTVTISDTSDGLIFTPNLHGLPPGVHGFHVHALLSCDDGGKGAGGHFDPQNTGKHLGPYGKGHLGDLPVLIVEEDGDATLPELAPHLKKLSQVKQHALIIHAEGDNYSDTPQKLGGGGARIACGIIE